MVSGADERAASDPRRALFLPYLEPATPDRATRTVSAEEAIAAIPDGSRVHVGASSGTPMALMEALATGRSRFTDLEIVFAYLMTRPAVLAHAGDPFRFITTQASPAWKHLWGSGHVQILPARYSDYRSLFTPSGPLPVDVSIVQVSPPGPEGRVSLGTSVGTMVDAARSAPLVIAQVNESVPYTFGASELELSQIDLLVEHTEPMLLSNPPDTSGDLVARSIAEQALEFVGDECTIQFGLGSIPDAILADLGDRRRLRVHSGMITDACIDLLEGGAVIGPICTAEMSTTARMIEWIDRNEDVLMAPAGYTHGATVLAAQPNLRTLNSTLEVALDGAMNSESNGGKVVSGPGGAPDYAMAGSALGTGARSIIGLKSTAAKGTISRIVSSIGPLDSTMLPNYLADVVITEHGTAEVRGLPLSERAEALIAIAHPDHRQALQEPTSSE